MWISLSIFLLLFRNTRNDLIPPDHSVCRGCVSLRSRKRSPLGRYLAPLSDFIGSKCMYFMRNNKAVMMFFCRIAYFFQSALATDFPLRLHVSAITPPLRLLRWLCHSLVWMPRIHRQSFAEISNRISSEVSAMHITTGKSVSKGQASSYILTEYTPKMYSKH